jgi:hypothetical protein
LESAVSGSVRASCCSPSRRAFSAPRRNASDTKTPNCTERFQAWIAAGRGSTRVLASQTMAANALAKERKMP